ncbi:MAG: hypothetical protein ACREJM_07625, partial [Candidatus Saccharimonadales bacterium]
AYRTAESDGYGGVIYSSWTSFPFVMEDAAGNATIQNLHLVNITGAAGPPAVTSDASLAGSVSGAVSLSATIVELDDNGDDAPDAAATPDAYGNFSASIATLQYGDVTVRARAVEFDAVRGIYLYGPWTSLSFSYQPPPAPAIAQLSLANDTGGTANPGHTTDPTLTGQIAAPSAGQTVSVEFDTNGDGIADASATVDGTNVFSYKPDNLEPGPVTVKVRTVAHQANSDAVSYGAWTSLSFTYVVTPGATPVVSSVSLDTSSSTSGAASAGPPAITGQISKADGTVDYQTVQFDTNGDGVPDGETTTDASGNFSYTPRNIPAGTTNIQVRGKVWDDASGTYLYSDWSSVSYNYQPPTVQPVTVSDFTLLNNMGDDSAPAADDPTVVGQLA